MAMGGCTLDAVDDEMSRGMAGGELEAPIASSHVEPPPAASEEDPTEELLPEQLPVSLAWQDIAPGFETTITASQTSLSVQNEAEEEVVVHFDYAGDLGTTKTYTGKLSSVILPPHAEAELHVDLQALFPTLETTYSGRVHVTARVHSTTGDALIAQVVGPGLFFHQTNDQTSIYDEDTLRNSFRAGDFTGLHDETAVLIDPEMDSDTVRVLGYEPSGETPDADMFASEQPAEPFVLGIDDDFSTGDNHAAFPFPHTLCVRFKVQTYDSGFTNSVGIAEDIWATANDPSVVPARGVRVRFGSNTYDTNSGGCKTFYSTAAALTFDARVFALAKDGNNNLVRIHNGPADSEDSYPGATYSIYVSSLTTYAYQVVFLDVGGYVPRWTAMGALSESLHRFNDNVINTAYHASDKGACGINQNYANHIPEKRSYIRFVQDGCNPNSKRAKFVVAHEYGHAYGYQRAQKSNQIPANPDHQVTPSSCSLNPGTAMYDNLSKEWSSIAAREGYAHFISARVWNDPDPDGRFTWGSQSFDLARWDSSEAPGGRLVNVCCPFSPSQCAFSLSGAGALPDWTRAFWAMHTGPTCALNKELMSHLYGILINSSGLTNKNFFSKSRDALNVLVPWCVPRWDEVACHHGIDRVGQIWSGC
jgi:hypothetical protein